MLPNLSHDTHTRGYIPHIQEAKYQSITYRLADSLPLSTLKKLQEQHPKNNEHRSAIETDLDAGHGSCLLAQPTISQLLIENWLHFHKKRYHLIAYVVMPNHVHLLIELFQGETLSKIVHSWKSYTAKGHPQDRRRPACTQPDLAERILGPLHTRQTPLQNLHQLHPSKPS